MKLQRSVWGTVAILALAGMLSAFTPPPAPATTLTETEGEGLLYMRQEEKLAFDLYTALDDAYGLPVFANIARSEAQHMQLMLDLLQAYGLPDPAQGLGAGEFSDPILQSLYNDLLSRAQTSQEEALRVAALVEETDILDLQQRLAAASQVELVTAYRNLLAASGMHLRAFAGLIERGSGVEYAPQRMTAEAYEQALADSAGGRWFDRPGLGRGRTG